MNLVKLTSCYSVITRNVSSTSSLYGKKTRDPFDSRFPLSTKKFMRHRKGCNKDLERPMARVLRVVPDTGVIRKITGKYHNVPEMIPEFIVPDLTGFQLQPYVSYAVQTAPSPKLTARSLFNACLKDDVIKEIKTNPKDKKDSRE